MTLACLAALALASACAESTVIRTTPPGAAVSVNGAPVGRAPATFAVGRWDFREPYRYRVELPGHVSKEGRLQVKAQPARVIGIVLTYGVLAAFRKPTTFEDEYHFRLEPSACTPLQEDAIRRAGLDQASVDVVCAQGYAGPPRVIAPRTCTPAQTGTMTGAGLSVEQARRACGW